jgi:hypothetical protein
MTWVENSIFAVQALKKPIGTACHVHTEDVIGSGEVVIAQGLGRLGEIAHRHGIATRVDQGQRYTELHGQPPTCSHHIAQL